MKKTREIELQEYHKELANYFYHLIYRDELRDAHTLGCAFNDAEDNRCDCVLMDAYKLLKHWVRA